MTDLSTRKSSRSTTPVLSKSDQAAQEEQLRQFKEAATRGATKTPIPPEDLSVELSALRAQLTSEDGAAQDLQERLDRLEAERQVAVLRAQLQERNRTTQALRDRLQQADHHNQATAFRTAHNAALTARVSFDADSSRNPPSPPLSSSSSSEADASHSSSDKEPTNQTTARAAPARKAAAAKVTTETRVGHTIVAHMLRKSVDGSVATAVEHFKGIDAPHNAAQSHELRRVARLLDMVMGNGQDKPRSRQAIVEFLARTALGLRQVLKADEGVPRRQAFKFLTAAASSDAVEAEAPPAFLKAIYRKMREVDVGQSVLAGTAGGFAKYKSSDRQSRKSDFRASRHRDAYSRTHTSRSRSASRSRSSVSPAASDGDSGSDDPQPQRRRTQDRRDKRDKRTGPHQDRRTRSASKSRAPSKKPTTKPKRAAGGRN